MKVAQALYRARQLTVWPLVKHLVYAVRRRVVLAWWFWKVRRWLGPIQQIVEIGPGIRPQTRLRAARRTMVEPYAGYAEGLERSGYTVVRQTAQAHAETTDLTGAVVLCCDMIEHLDKAEGQRLIGTWQRTAAAIVLYTPLGFMPQDADPWGLGGEYWQKHRSGWTPAEFPDWACLVDTRFHGDQGMGAFLAVWRRSWASTH